MPSLSVRRTDLAQEAGTAPTVPTSTTQLSRARLPSRRGLVPCPRFSAIHAPRIVVPPCAESHTETVVRHLAIVILGVPSCVTLMPEGRNAANQEKPSR